MSIPWDTIHTKDASAPIQSDQNRRLLWWLELTELLGFVELLHQGIERQKQIFQYFMSTWVLFSFSFIVLPLLNEGIEHRQVLPFILVAMIAGFFWGWQLLRKVAPDQRSLNRSIGLIQELMDVHRDQLSATQRTIIKMRLERIPFA